MLHFAYFHGTLDHQSDLDSAKSRATGLSSDCNGPRFELLKNSHGKMVETDNLHDSCRNGIQTPTETRLIVVVFHATKLRDHFEEKVANWSCDFTYKLLAFAVSGNDAIENGAITSAVSAFAKYNIPAWPLLVPIGKLGSCPHWKAMLENLLKTESECRADFAAVIDNYIGLINNTVIATPSEIGDTEMSGNSQPIQSASIDSKSLVTAMTILLRAAMISLAPSTSKEPKQRFSNRRTDFSNGDWWISSLGGLEREAMVRLLANRPNLLQFCERIHANDELTFEDVNNALKQKNQA